jgi:hypothetical protein
MKFMVWEKTHLQHFVIPSTPTLSPSEVQVQNTPLFAAVQTEGALSPLMSHQERVSILKSEIHIEVGVSLFKMLTILYPVGTCRVSQ